MESQHLPTRIEVSKEGVEIFTELLLGSEIGHGVQKLSLLVSQMRPIT